MSLHQIITCVLGIALLYSITNNKDQIIEHFGMLPRREVRVEILEEKDGKLFTVPPNYQALLNPRQAGNADVGAFIRYKPPAQAMRADSMGTLISEKPVITEGFKDDAEQSELPGFLDGIVPIEGSCGPGKNTTNEFGDIVPQPCLYQNYVYANTKSRLQGDQDHIRGSIPVTPEKGWFRPPVDPAKDLRLGALFVMGGIDNDTTKELIALKSLSTGKLQDVGSGVKYNISRAQSLGAGKADVKVTPVGFY